MIPQFLKITAIFILVSVAGAFHAKGQNNVELADSIEYHAHELIQNHDLEVRRHAFDFLNANLGELLNEYSNFRDSFPRYEGLAVQENQNPHLRIVTYQLYRDTSSYDYGGWVQSDRLKKPVFLYDASPTLEKDSDADFMTLDADDWYGALYYQMMPLSISDEEMIILLLGLDNYHFFTKRKILDILVVRDGVLYFGHPAIEMEEGLPEEYRKKRFILDYSVQAPATLRYDPVHEKIIFDHLMFMPSDIPEQRIMRVPDGTYSGFKIDKEEQKLVFIEKVFDQVLEEAPGGREKPVENRDLFGEPKKK